MNAFGKLDHFLFGNLAADDDELVTADPVDGLSAFGGTEEAVCNGRNRFVSCFVSLRIVNGLKAVHIDRYKCRYLFRIVGNVGIIRLTV